jgi:hypothetical protein
MSRLPWSGHLVNGHAAIDGQYGQESADWEDPKRSKGGDSHHSCGAQAGLSLKALRLYDENGLLRPAGIGPDEKVCDIAFPLG